MQDFRNLVVWEKSHLLVLDVYKTTSTFPKSEMYGLTSQIRRACSSIPANIAEGCCRGSDLEFAQFLTIALGSASELEYHLLLAKDLQLLNPDNYLVMNNKTNEIKKILVTLISKLKKKPVKIK